jgi:hypothetical protein
MMTQLGAAFVIGVGLLMGAVVGFVARAEPLHGLSVLAISALVGALCLALLFVFNRHAFRRGSGWYGLKPQQRRMASSNVNSDLVGKVSAAGGALGVGLVAVLASVLGVTVELFLVALGGLIAGFLVCLGLLQSYHLWRARRFYGAEHDVTDI